MTDATKNIEAKKMGEITIGGGATISQEQLIDVFKQCVDPELGIDIWTLGLIYKVDVKNSEGIHVLMTFTSPFCPYGPAIVEELKELLEAKRMKEIDIQITFEPPWQPSEELREMMGM